MSEQILFYSKKCVNCKQLLSLLEKSPHLLNTFLIICIDDKRYRIPKAIKRVPSAIIPSPMGEPQIFTGKSLFDWVKNRIHSQQRNSNPTQNNYNKQQHQQQNYQQNQRNQNQNNRNQSQNQNSYKEVEPEVWDSFMMNNLSGTFAFIDDNENEKVKDKSGFASLNSIYNFKIQTPDDDGIKGKGDIKPVSYSANDYEIEEGNRNSGNPFADNNQSYQNQNQNQYNPNEYNSRANMSQSFDPNMFRDSNYEGNDSRSNSRKSQFDSQMEAFKNSRDMGMPQPIRRM